MAGFGGFVGSRMVMERATLAPAGYVSLGIEFSRVLRSFGYRRNSLADFKVLFNDGKPSDIREEPVNALRAVAYEKSDETSRENLGRRYGERINRAYASGRTTLPITKRSGAGVPPIKDFGGMVKRGGAAYRTKHGDKAPKVH